MSRPSRLAAAVLAAALLAGCGGAATTYGFYAEPRYSSGELGFVSRQGPVPVEVRGNPFSVPDARLAAAVADAMQGRNFGPPLAFTDRPPGERPYDYRVVMAFDQPPQASFDLCAAAAPPEPATQGGPLHAKAAFCLGRYRYTEIQGSIPAASGPDDPRFRTLIAQLTIELLPANDPSRFGNDCGPGDC